MFVEDVRRDRRRGELQIDARVLAERRIVDQLAERVKIIRRLR